MARIEVDEAEFNEAQRVVGLLKKANATPEGKKLLERVHKTIDPNAPTPTLDDDERKEQEKTEWQKKFEELQAGIQADKEKRETDANLSALNAKVEAGRAKLREGRYTSEGIEAVEKFMQERGIADHEIAAKYLESQNPPAEPLSSRAFGSFGFIEQPKEGDHFLKALLDSRGDDDSAVLRQASEAIGQLRGGVRRS